MSKTTITAKMRADGRIVEVMSDGSERPFMEKPMREMTEAEIEAAAAADPDARPMTPEELQTARQVPRVKTLRRALGLTQQEFAARYRIPLGTLRDWEQGRTEPDQPPRAYLTVVARDRKAHGEPCQGTDSRNQPRNPVDPPKTVKNSSAGFEPIVDDDQIGAAPGQHAADRGGEPAALRGRVEFRHRRALRREARRRKQGRDRRRDWRDPR
jgi:putative transcriptional regulator